MALDDVVLAGRHHPAAFDAAMRDARLHGLQHLSAFLTAGLFWRPVLDPYASVPRVFGVTAIGDQTTGWIVMGLVDGVVSGAALFGIFGRCLHGRGESD